MKIEQLRQQNAQVNSLKWILGEENTLLDAENRKKLEKDKRTEDNIIKYVKSLFRLKKE